MRKLNEEAFEDLMLVMPGDTKKGMIAFTMVRKSKSKELKNGDAELAWREMRIKFEPSSAPDCLMLKEKLLGMKQAKFQNLEEFITELEDKALEYQTAGGNWNDRETLEHIYGNVQK